MPAARLQHRPPRRRLVDAIAAAATHFVELGEVDPKPLPTYRRLCRAGFEEGYQGRKWQRPACPGAI